MIDFENRVRCVIFWFGATPPAPEFTYLKNSSYKEASMAWPRMLPTD